MAAVNEAIQIFRKLTAGENVAFQGEVFKTAGAKFNFKTKNKILVYVGAQGPKMLEMAVKSATVFLLMRVTQATSVSQLRWR